MVHVPADGRYIGFRDAARGHNGQSISTSWARKAGSITAPADAATMRIALYLYHATGWVTFDDVAVDSDAVITKYYYFNDQRVAMRKNGVIIRVSPGFQWVGCFLTQLAGAHPARTCPPGQVPPLSTGEAWNSPNVSWQGPRFSLSYRQEIPPKTDGTTGFSAKFMILIRPH